MYPIFHTTSQSLIVLTTVFFIFPCTGLNDHSYDVEKRPRRTAKPRRPARDPPKERMSTYSVGVVLRDWTIQFLECCYNILMKVVRVSTMLEILNFCNSKQRYVKVHFLRVKKLCVSVKTGLFWKIYAILFMSLNVACIVYLWRDNIYVIQIYATAAWLT